eukprot:COSAG02_NODE_2983_length_7620_cov_73.890271_8_plen_363_part_00
MEGVVRGLEALGQHWESAGARWRHQRALLMRSAPLALWRWLSARLPGCPPGCLPGCRCRCPPAWLSAWLSASVSVCALVCVCLCASAWVCPGQCHTCDEARTAARLTALWVAWPCRAVRADFAALKQQARNGALAATLPQELDRLDEYVASRLASLAKSLSREQATPRTPTRDGWVALANERAERTIVLSRFIGLHRLGLDRVVEQHDRGRPVGERMLPGVRERLEQSGQSFWRQRRRIRPLLDDIASLFSRGGQYDGVAQPGDGSLQDGFTFSRKTRKFWVPAESELEVMTRLLPHLPLYYFGKHVAKGSKGQCAESDPATTSVYLDSADFSLYRTRLRREVRLQLFLETFERAISRACCS